MDPARHSIQIPVVNHQANSGENLETSVDEQPVSSHQQVEHNIDSGRSDSVPLSPTQPSGLRRTRSFDSYLNRNRRSRFINVIDRTD